MARKFSVFQSSGMGTAAMLLVMSSVGLVLVTTLTDAAAIIPQNYQPPVKIFSRLTEQFVAVQADGTVHANGAWEDST